MNDTEKMLKGAGAHETVWTNHADETEVPQVNRYKYHNEKGEHLHTLDGRPLIGTSSVSKATKSIPPWYASGEAVKVFGVPDPKVLTKVKNGKATQDEKLELFNSLRTRFDFIKDLTLGEYQKLVDQAYRAHDTRKKKAAAEGTDAHTECERFIKDHMEYSSGPPRTYSPTIHPFIHWAHENVKRFLWSEGHCYSEKHWLGGICDTGYESHCGKCGILDFKNREKAYIQDLWQCAGYAIQIEENGVLDGDGNQVRALTTPEVSYFDELCVWPLKAKDKKPVYNFDVAGSKEAFLAELLLYKKLPQD